jgi:predicted transcriptional regulator
MGHAQSIDSKIADYVSFLSDKKKKTVLAVVKTFAEDETDLWDEMPDEIKASVKRGLKESEKGLGKPHEEVMKKYRKWLKK